MGWLSTCATRTATGAGSGGAAALVRSPLHAAERSAARERRAGEHGRTERTNHDCRLTRRYELQSNESIVS